jgi:MFS family permease
MSEKAQKIFYGWYLVILGSFVLATVTGLVSNSNSQFIKPVCEAFGFTRGEFTLYMSFTTIAMVICIPLSKKVYGSINPRIVITFGSLLVIASWTAMSLAQALYHFYILGALIGMGLSFCSTAAVNMLLSNWFIKKRGTVIGMAMLGSGLGAMVWNPLLSYLITSHSYQYAYRVTGLIALIIMIPYYIMYRFKPEDIGLEPYGKGEAGAGAGGKGKIKQDPNAEGYMLRDIVRTPRFWALCFITMVFPMCTKGVYTQLQPYFTDLGLSAIFAASLISVISLCQAIGKPVLGWINDKFGIRTCFNTAAVFFFFGIGFITLAGLVANSTVMYLAVFLFGCGMAVPTVISPLLAAGSFGRKDFIAIYGLASSFFFVGPPIGPPLSAFVYDYSGSYLGAFVAYLIIVVVTFILGNWLLAPKKQILSTVEGTAAKAE